MAGSVSVRRTGEVLVATLEHPPVNALSHGVRVGLMAALDAAAADPGVRALVLRGAGRNFSAGADVREFGRPFAPPELGEVIERTEAFDKPVIAALHGSALGGGLELALACHFRVALAGTRLGLPEVKLGIIPGGGGTQRLPRLVGVARAKDLILTGRQVDAAEALAIGLVDRVVEPGELLDAAIAYAADLARGPLAAHALAKQAIDRGLEGTLSDGLALEQQAFVEVFRTEDSQAGVASFLEHGPGKATFTGR